MTESHDTRTRLGCALDGALERTLRRPQTPATLRARVSAARARPAETDLAAVRARLEGERRQQLEALEADYLRVRRSTLGTLIGVAFAAGAAAAIAMPWLRAHLGDYTPAALTWGGAALGLGMVFFHPARALLRRWADLG